MPAPPILSPDSSQIDAETLEELSRSFARERTVKALIFVAVFCITALFGKSAHPYLPIVFFGLLVDVFSINRQQRLIASLRAILEAPGEPEPEFTDR